MYDALKYLALPPASFLLVLIVGSMFTLCRWRRVGTLVTLLGIIAGYLISTPFVAAKLGQLIETVPVLRDSSPIDNGSQAIVVLAAGLSPYAPEYGGSTVDYVALQRLRYAAHLWRRHELPILISGGRPPGAAKSLAALMKEAMVSDFDVPVRWLEERSQNTKENADFSVAILREHGVSKILLVTDAGHIARAMKLFEATGMVVVPAPMAFAAPARTFPTDYLPYLSGLQGSYYALYEIIAAAWYSIRYPSP